MRADLVGLSFAVEPFEAAYVPLAHDYPGSVAWGARFYNGKGEQQMSIFFPNPFLTDEQQIAEKPAWSRLAIWDDLTRRYLGRGSDPKDRSGTGFSHG